MIIIIISVFSFSKICFYIFSMFFVWVTFLFGKHFFFLNTDFFVIFLLGGSVFWPAFFLLWCALLFFFLNLFLASK